MNSWRGASAPVSAAERNRCYCPPVIALLAVAALLLLAFFAIIAFGAIASVCGFLADMFSPPPTDAELADTRALLAETDALLAATRPRRRTSPSA